MNALLGKPDTVVPNDEDARIAAESSRILSAARSGHELRVRLEDGRELRLPAAAARLLAHLLAEMAQGNAVAVIPVHAELTTQEAADFLNVSRPYLVRLLEERAIPHHKVGTHRRVRFQDLNAYRERMAAERAAALDELAAQTQELGMGY